MGGKRAKCFETFDGGRRGRVGRERESLNSKTLLLKDCRIVAFGPFGQPVWAASPYYERGRERERERETDTDTF